MDDTVTINRRSLVRALNGIALLLSMGQTRADAVTNFEALAERVRTMGDESL